MPTFFVDRSLGRKLVAAALRTAGWAVVVHDDVFAPDTPDTEWLARAGREGWVVLTKDNRLRYKPAERRALVESGVRVVVLTSPALTGPEMAALLVDAADRIAHSVARRGDAAFIATLTKGPVIRVVWPPDGAD